MRFSRDSKNSCRVFIPGNTWLFFFLSENDESFLFLVILLSKLKFCLSLQNEGEIVTQERSTGCVYNSGEVRQVILETVLMTILHEKGMWQEGNRVCSLELAWSWLVVKDVDHSLIQVQRRSKGVS